MLFSASALMLEIGTLSLTMTTTPSAGAALNAQASSPVQARPILRGLSFITFVDWLAGQKLKVVFTASISQPLFCRTGLAALSSNWAVPFM